MRGDYPWYLDSLCLLSLQSVLVSVCLDALCSDKLPALFVVVLSQSQQPSQWQLSGYPCSFTVMLMSSESVSRGGVSECLN